MAFFNLTLLGPQDPFKAAVSEPGKDKNPGVSSPAHHPSSTNPVATTPPGPTAAGLELETSGPEQKSPASGQGESPSKPEQKATQTSTESAEELPPLHPSLIAAPPFAEPHGGSYLKQTELLHKHRRNRHGPNQLYQHTLTGNQENGRWLLDTDHAHQQWSRHHRHAHVNSEMTRFVDEMSITNKDFQLF